MSNIFKFIKSMYETMIDKLPPEYDILDEDDEDDEEKNSNTKESLKKDDE